MLCIPPFNYPVNLAVSKIAPALMAGNSVVVKPPTQVRHIENTVQHWHGTLTLTLSQLWPTAMRGTVHETCREQWLRRT